MADQLDKIRTFLTGGEKAVRATMPERDPFPSAPAGPEHTLVHPGAERHLSAYGGREAIDHVMTATRKIIVAASQARSHFERDDGEILVPKRGPDTAPDAPLAPQTLVQLLERPNPWVGYKEMLQTAIIDLLLTGNAYLLGYNPTVNSRRPAALYRLAPPYVSVKTTRKKLIDRYEYQLPGMERPTPYEPRDVTHLRLPNPLSPGGIYGTGLITAAPKMYDIELSLVDTMRSFFARGAKLSGTVSSDRTVPDPTLKKLQRQFQRMYGGSHAAYQVAVLERGLKFQPIQPTAADAQFEGISKMTRDRIFAAFGVPVELLYRGEGSGATDIEGARRLFAEETVAPLLEYVAEEITQKVASRWGVKFVIDYAYSLPEVERISQAQEFSTVPGVRVREVREKLGLAPLGPDEKDPETGEVIDDIVLNLPSPSTEGPKAGGGGDPDQPLAGEAGRPPEPEHTRRFNRQVNGRDSRPADRRRREQVGRKAISGQADPDSLIQLAIAEARANATA